MSRCFRPAGFAVLFVIVLGCGAGITSPVLIVAIQGTGTGSVADLHGEIACSTGSTGLCRATMDNALTLTATPGPNSTFAGWSGCVTDPSPTITVSGAQAVANGIVGPSNPKTAVCTATFTTPQVQVTVQLTGSGVGTVSSAPAGLSCPITCLASFGAGSTVTLTATPAASSVFAGWSGALSCISPTNPVLPVTVSSAITCNVRFDLVTSDTDGDGIANPVDNCPTVANTNQLDGNNDGVGDACANGCFNAVVFFENFDAIDPFTESFVGTGSSHGKTLITTGGNPGGYLLMSHTVPAGSNINVDHLNPGVYIPATQGRILHLEYSEDRIKLIPQNATEVVGGSFHLIQGGVGRQYVINGLPSFTSQVWEHVQTTFTRSQLINVNLNSTGAPLQFGFRRSNSNGTAATLNTTHGIDNWQVRVCRDP